MEVRKIMNRIDLIKKLSNVITIKKNGEKNFISSFTLSEKKATQAVNIFFDTIKAALREGERVEIRGFGVFKVRKKKAHMARNPKTGEVVAVPEKSVPFFKTSTTLKNILKGEKSI